MVCHLTGRLAKVHPTRRNRPDTPAPTPPKRVGAMIVPRVSQCRLDLRKLQWAAQASRATRKPMLPVELSGVLELRAPTR